MILWWKKEVESLGHGIYKKLHGPKVKEKHEEEHEDSKKEEPEQPVILSRITRLPAWYELTKSNQAEELKVVMKNSVWKTYE